jgi:hypothetical protein
MSKKSKRQEKFAQQFLKIRKADRFPWTRGSVVTLAVALALSAALYTWFATWGTGKLFVTESFGQYYDGLAESLEQGRLDVAPPAISGEAFIVDGKTYGYFGFGPAIPRMLLNKVWPRHKGQWSRLSLIVAGCLHVLLAFLILRRLRCLPARPLPLLFLASIGAGSTVVYMTARCYIYHEASIWGAAFALISAYFALGAFFQPSVASATGAVGAGLVASWCRVVPGMAALAMCAVLFCRLVFAFPEEASSADTVRLARQAGVRLGPSKLNRGLQIAVLASGLAVGFASYIWYNHARFGTYFNGVPAKYMVQMNDKRLAHIGGTLFHYEFALPLAWEYLSPTYIGIRSSFPWITFPAHSRFGPPPMGFDYAEPHAGLLAFSPGLAVLSILGVWVGVRRYSAPAWLRMMLLALLLPLPILLTMALITQRYLHDLFPFLAVAGAVGVAWLEAGENVRHRTRLKVLAGILLAWSIPASLSLAIVFQREVTWGVDDSVKVEFQQFRHKVDGFFHGN